jgi:hypothetical protein
MRKTKAQRMAELAEKEATRIHRHNRMESLNRLSWRVTESAKLYIEDLARSKQQTAGKTF